MDRFTLTWNLPCGQVGFDVEFPCGQVDIDMEFTLLTG